jgi:hypothetical protein
MRGGEAPRIDYPRIDCISFANKNYRWATPIRKKYYALSGLPFPSPERAKSSCEVVQPLVKIHFLNSDGLHPSAKNITPFQGYPFPALKG